MERMQQGAGGVRQQEGWEAWQAEVDALHL